jgi:hypothetical protein
MPEKLEYEVMGLEETNGVFDGKHRCAEKKSNLKI